jgi:hypothetical protein
LAEPYRHDQKSTNSFLSELGSPRFREASHADRKIDLRWFDRFFDFVGDAGPGEERVVEFSRKYERAKGRGNTGRARVPRLPASGGWILGRVVLQGGGRGRPGSAARQVGNLRPRPGNALALLQAERRVASRAGFGPCRQDACSFGNPSRSTTSGSRPQERTKLSSSCGDRPVLCVFTSGWKLT